MSAGPKTYTLTDHRANSVQVPSLRVVVTVPGGGNVDAPLGATPLVIGTSPGTANLVVSDTLVSRRHCELTITERGVRLRDLGSKNGTHVGGIAVVEAIVPPDVIVTIGGCQLVVRAMGPPTRLELFESANFHSAIGASVIMRALFANLEKVAPHDQTVLLLGETGTGKQVLAQAIHDASPRRGRPLVTLDCGTLPPSLVESELFGYERGAFTDAKTARAGVFERANGGTLLIDEIGELPIDLQPKLLRALQERKAKRLGGSERAFDCRVIAATHQDLHARMAERQFRQDLYYRIAVIVLRVPPLREHKEDIPLLVDHFLAAKSKSRADLPLHAIPMLCAHDWPGNIRELENIVERLLVLPNSWPTGPSDGNRDTGVTPSIQPLFALGIREASREWLERFRPAYLAAKLREAEWNIPRAAKAMGVKRQYVHRLATKYGLVKQKDQDHAEPRGRDA